MTPISLDWKRPTLGMEVIEAAQSTELFGQTDNRVFVVRGGDTTPVRYEIRDWKIR